MTSQEGISDSSDLAVEHTAPPPERLEWRPLLLYFGLPLAVILVLDLVTKAWFFRDGSLAAAQARYAHHAYIEPHVNTGVAWSIMGDHPGLVTALTLVLIPVLAWAWWRWFRGQGRLEDLAFGCILGGALGNAWDRVAAVAVADPTWGGVRDFIHVDLNVIGIDYIWPTFNIADVGISIGFVALVLGSFRGKRNPPSPETAA